MKEIDEINKIIIRTFVAQAMLSFALARLEDVNVSSDKIAKEYAEKIIEELK